MPSPDLSENKENELKIISKVAIGDCASIIAGVNPLAKGKQKRYAYNAIQPGQLTVDGLVGESATILRDIPCNEEQILKPGDVLLKRLNPDCAVVFEGSSKPMVTSANIFIIRPRQCLDSRYLAFLLEKSKLMQRISQLSGVGTTVAALTASKIAGGIIPLPSLDEQTVLGNLWALSKKQKSLLRAMSLENDRLMCAVCGKLYQ